MEVLNSNQLLPPPKELVVELKDMATVFGYLQRRPRRTPYSPDVTVEEALAAGDDLFGHDLTGAGGDIYDGDVVGEENISPSSEFACRVVPECFSDVGGQSGLILGSIATLGPGPGASSLSGSRRTSGVSTTTMLDELPDDTHAEPGSQHSASQFFVGHLDQLSTKYIYLTAPPTFEHASISTSPSPLEIPGFEEGPVKQKSKTLKTEDTRVAESVIKQLVAAVVTSVGDGYPVPHLPCSPDN